MHCLGVTFLRLPTHFSDFVFKRSLKLYIQIYHNSLKQDQLSTDLIQAASQEKWRWLRTIMYELRIFSKAGLVTSKYSKISSIKSKIYYCICLSNSSGTFNNIYMSYMCQCMQFPTKWYVRPAKPKISLRIRAV